MDGRLTDQTEAILHRLTAMAPLVTAHQPAFDSERRLSAPVIEAMVAADLFRLWAPRKFGGAELSPRALIDIVETAAAIDASFGWCIANASASGQLSGHLPEQVAARWVSDPDSQMAGSTAALGSARRTEGGFLVTGRWPFASGILSARYVNCLCKIEGEGDPANPELIFAHVPADQVAIIDTWHVTGLRGTGSNDFTLTDHFVPTDQTHGFVGSSPVQPGRLYRFPIVSLLCLTVGTVPLGIAQAAIAAFVAGAERTRFGAGGPFKDRELIQDQIGRAEALRRASKALVVSALDDLDQALDIGGQELTQARAHFRLALAHSAETCVQVVDRMVACAGAAAIFESSPLARCQRDVHAATQHVAVGPHLFALAGRIRLGMEPGLARF